MAFPRKALAVFFPVLHGLALLLSGCTNDSTSPQDTLTTIISSPIQSLNPLLTTDANSQHVNELIHAGLINIDDSLMPKPYLAAEMRLIGPQIIEFRLRENCVFPGGRPITTDDVEKSLRYFRDPARGSPFSEAFKTISRIEKIDSLRFRIHTTRPSPALLTDLNLLKILDLDKIDPNSNPTHIPGAGPYELESMSAAQINLVRRPQPCFPTPPMPRIKVKVVRDDLSRYFKLKTGEIDVVMNEMNYRKVEAIEADPSIGLRVKRGEGIGYTYLGLNLASEKLRNPNVRRALALSLDLPTLIRHKSRGMAIPARNILSDGNFYANTSVPILSRDLAEARRLLGEAGYFDGKNGKPRLQLVFSTNTSPISIENARVLVAQAQEAGIDLKHKANEWGIFYNDVKTGNTEVYMLRWVGVTDPRIYFEVFHSGEIGRGNRTRYRNKEVDRLLEIGESAIDTQTRLSAYFKVQDIVAKDLPYIGLWYGMNVTVFREEVKDVFLHPSGSWLPLLRMRKE